MPHADRLDLVGSFKCLLALLCDDNSLIQSNSALLSQLVAPVCARYFLCHAVDAHEANLEPRSRGGRDGRTSELTAAVCVCVCIRLRSLSFSSSSDCRSTRMSRLEMPQRERPRLTCRRSRTRPPPSWRSHHTKHTGSTLFCSALAFAMRVAHQLPFALCCPLCVCRRSTK